MANKATERRQRLYSALIEAAETRIAQSGLRSLHARDLARDVGCAVGSIYNVFDDFSGLILAVNGRTFQALGHSVRESLTSEAAMTAPPATKLIVMSKAYTEFASTHPLLWRALFDIEMSSQDQVPDWYLEALSDLFRIIAEPIMELDPAASPAEIDLFTRTFFSSVHGIVWLGLESRISAVPKSQIDTMVTDLVIAYAEKIERRSKIS